MATYTEIKQLIKLEEKRFIDVNGRYPSLAEYESIEKQVRQGLSEYEYQVKSRAKQDYLNAKKT